jgi:hypothetical protein
MTHTKDEALKLALEALQYTPTLSPAVEELCDAAITVIKQALAAPVQPVAWMHVMDNTEGIKANGKGIVSITQKRKHPFGKPGVDFSKSYPVTSTPLYTAPPNVATPLAAQRQSARSAWVGLTDEERRACTQSPFTAENYRAIEAKLKAKNSL